MRKKIPNSIINWYFIMRSPLWLHTITLSKKSAPDNAIHRVLLVRFFFYSEYQRQKIHKLCNCLIIFPLSISVVFGFFSLLPYIKLEFIHRNHYQNEKLQPNMLEYVKKLIWIAKSAFAKKLFGSIKIDWRELKQCTAIRHVVLLIIWIQVITRRTIGFIEVIDRKRKQPMGLANSKQMGA